MSDVERRDEAERRHEEEPSTAERRRGPTHPGTTPGASATSDKEEPSTAEREGIVDQQDAVLEAIEEVETPHDPDDPMTGEAPTG